MHRLCLAHPKRLSVAASLVAAAVTLTNSTATAQNLPSPIVGAGEPAAAAKVGKILRAFRIDGAPPRIDGQLDDEVWRHAESAEGLVQGEPDNMAPLSERTAMQVAYDDRYLYAAVRCYDREPAAVQGPLTRRDEIRGAPSDVIAVGFDPRHDHLTGYAFMTNPSGVQNDFFFFNDEAVDRDYDAVWEVRTSRTSDGWVAEFRIPFSQMRFERAPGAETVWGFGVRREIYRKSEFGTWVGKPRGERGEVSRWGHLVFADALTPPRRVEVLPYVVARHDGSVADAEGGAAGTGVDLRLGLGTSTTLSATINPDFGQVELDPAVLNLTVFETFFPEKRPFFLEDSRTFVPAFEIFQLFHSRRIGRQPSRFATGVGGRIVERPDQTSVLAAAKLTGKTSGWTFGALSAVTAREYAAIDVTDAATGFVSRRDALLEPLTSYNVARVQRDILNGSSSIGGIVTAVVRERDADAFSGGIDYNLRWHRNRDQLSGHWGVTRAPGTGGTRTGIGGLTNFNVSRKHWGVFSHLSHFGRDFRVTDMGFHRGRVDSTQTNAGASLSQPDPGKVFRRISVGANVGQSWNGDRLVFARFAGGGANLQLLNFWTIDVFGGRGFRVLDDLDTRGGPPIVRPADLNVNLFVNTDSRKSWRITLGGGAGRDEEGGWSVRVGPSLRLQPSPRLQTSIGSNYNRGRDVAQWIANADTDADGVAEHVYGTLRRDVVDVTVRATYALHRDLSLQVYLQPFVAVGDYTDIRRLARPRSFDFSPVSLASNPDFNRKSLRSNVVLRWEYLRGSTLFVVWNVSTFDGSRPGTFSPWRDLGDAFGGEGPQVFMVKLNYWIGR
ncbi:MAG: DUF5916 domain-containing protein [Acidobacteriota bacterium]